MEWFSRIPISKLVDSGEAELKTEPFGTQLKASEYTESGTPVINVRNIGMGEIKPDKLEHISDETRNRLSSHVLRRDGIVFGRKGAVERHVFIRPEQDGWFQGSDCLRLRFKSTRIDALFASYFFLTEDHKRWMMNQCSHGATMSSLNQGVLKRIELPAPPLPIQKRIAGILSAYDELNENNQRRIRILEEMTRGLYREWFVHFRYPDHDDVPLANSPLGPIPQGWEVQYLKDVCHLTMGQSPRSDFYNDTGEGLPFHQGVTDFGTRFPSDCGMGWAFTANDFAAEFGRSTVDWVFHKLVTKGMIRRIARGIYDYLKYCKLLQQELSPDFDQVARALARKFNSRITPSGDTALNLLGLSTHVPCKPVYLSDAPSRSYKMDNFTLSFKKAALKDVGFKSLESGFVVQALKTLRKERIDDKTISAIRSHLDVKAGKRALKDTVTATGCVYDAIKRICVESN